MTAVLRARARDSVAERLVGGGPSLCESRRIALEGVASLHDLDAICNVRRRPHIDCQSEPIQQLRPQFAFFGIAAADQDEPCGVADAQAFALDDVFARSRDVEQEIDEMILQQIDLVDVQKSPVALASKPGSKTLSPTESARSRLSAPTTRSSVAPSGMSTTGTGASAVGSGPKPARSRHSAHRSASAPIAAIRASGDDAHPRQQSGERPHRCRLSRASVAENQNPADGRIDRGDQQGPFHIVLADDRRKRKGECHRNSPIVETIAASARGPSHTGLSGKRTSSAVRLYNRCVIYY